MVTTLIMEKPIIVSYRWSEKEVLLLNRLYWQRSAIGRKHWQTTLGAALLSVVMIGVIPFQHSRWPMLLCTVIILSTASLVAIPWMMRRAVLRMYAQKPEWGMVVTYELSEEGLVSKSEIATTDLRWRTIQKVLRTPKGFLLYLTENNIHWLPVSGFQDPMEVEQFADFAKENLQGYENGSQAESSKSPLLTRKVKKYVFIWVMLVAFVLLLLAGHHWTDYRRLAAHGTMTQGQVLATFPGDNTTIRYTYKVAEKIFRGQGPVGPPNNSATLLSAGDTIDVCYDPDHPRNSVPGKPGPILLRETLRVVLSALVLPTFLIGIYLLSFSKKR